MSAEGRLLPSGSCWPTKDETHRSSTKYALYLPCFVACTTGIAVEGWLLPLMGPSLSHPFPAGGIE